MRRLVLCLVILSFVILISGCIQPVAQLVPAATTVPVPITSPTRDPDIPREVNFTVTKAGSFVNITYEGGPDAADLVSLNIRINNQNGQNVQRTIAYPIIGSPYVFTYKGVSDANVVNIVGTFSDGFQQTVLMYYL